MVQLVQTNDEMSPIKWENLGTSLKLAPNSFVVVRLVHSRRWGWGAEGGGNVLVRFCPPVYRVGVPIPADLRIITDKDYLRLLTSVRMCVLH